MAAPAPALVVTSISDANKSGELELEGKFAIAIEG
jgi:hypothetical protein